MQLTRTVRKHLFATATLALGIGTVTAVFGTYSATVLHPVNIPEVDRVISIYSVNRTLNFVPAVLSWPRFELIRRSASSFAALAAYSNDSVVLSGEANTPAEQLRTLRVSGDFFEAIGAKPARGRLFAPQEDVPNGPAVCVLSYELWQSRFGGRDVIGVTVPLNGSSVEIVGVLGPKLTAPWADRQIFLPRVFEDSTLEPRSISTGATYLEAIARLRPDSTIQQAANHMNAVSAQYAREFAGNSDAGSTLQVESITDNVSKTRRPVFYALLTAVGLVLLVSCANAAALFLSHVASQEREVAIRQALGASRGRIVRQFLRESLGAAAAAGILGVAAAVALLRLATTLLASQLPPGVELEVDGLALAAAIGAVLICSILVGLAPALHATRPGVRSPLAAFARGGSEGSGTRRFRASLVVVEITFAVVLLVGTALLVASLDRLQRTSPGFDPQGVAAAFVHLTPQRYDTAEKRSAFFVSLLQRLLKSPGVRKAAIVFGLPFHDENFASSYSVAGRPLLPPADRPRAGLRIVTEDYFDVMQIHLAQGRAFTADDRAGAPGVCIVNESLAKRQFGSASALGQMIRRGRAADQFYEIVGVVRDIKTNGLRSRTPDEIFFSWYQMPKNVAALVARTEGDPDGLAPVFRAAVSATDHTQALSRFDSMPRRLQSTLGPDRVLSGVTLAFSGAALFLSAVGLYAVLAHSVRTRMVEIGVRIALGATPWRVVAMVVGQGMRLVSLGIASGLVAAALFARLLASRLYSVEPHDPLVYLAVAAIFALTGAAACLAPALRGAKVEPILAIRDLD